MLKKTLSCFFLALLMASFFGCQNGDQKLDEPKEEIRMDWWRDARFGMFIHWGLYAIPAGEWKGTTNHAEWIRTTAEIPLEEYDQFLDDFNPVEFDAEAWVKMAKDAGMKYITITSKHHDGFGLYDSKTSDFDVMATPFKRDILKELADACEKAGIKLCFYHSIMDWHHPDYLPRRGWEKNRSTEGAEFPRYVDYMKNQLKELLTNYGEIGVLWFDGEWEDTWTHEEGVELYDYIRSLQPNIIINNRVDKGRQGMQGLTAEGNFVGDFGTPEQEIPDTGLPGIDWESCMTMNDHWGYNKNDDNWKSSEELIQNLVDIASKGGNFLLNIGPKADGTFPQESIERLAAIGEWMNANGASIYETQASPFEHLDWGRVTQKQINGGTRLYLHVFDWPENGELRLGGIRNEAIKASLLSAASTQLSIRRDEDALVIELPKISPNSIDEVISLDIKGDPEVVLPPEIMADEFQFSDQLLVKLKAKDGLDVRYTLDGSEPNASSTLYSQQGIEITKNTVLKAKTFEGLNVASTTSSAEFNKVSSQKAQAVSNLKSGINYAYYEGDWNQLPNFSPLKSTKKGTVTAFDYSAHSRDEYYAFSFEGYINVPENGTYRFYISSDDGSQLFINDQLVVDNDGLHGMVEKSGLVGLEKGNHKIKVAYLQKTGGSGLEVSWKGPSFIKTQIPASVLYHQ